MEDVQRDQGQEHGHGVEDVFIGLVRQNGICGRCALCVLSNTKDDSNLCTVRQWRPRKIGCSLFAWVNLL